MREITIQELEVVSGGVAPLIVSGAVILGKAAFVTLLRRKCG